MNDLISVVVPIYKVEVYLRDCLDSILEQSYQNLQIILVDDGSPDNCGAICDEYAQKDSRILVIHKENGGVADARNAGLRASLGKYIGFVDPDDWIAADMYEYLYNGLQEYGADMVVCGYYIATTKSAVATRRTEDRLFSGDEAVNALLTLKYGNYAWNKLYRRDLFDEIRYPVGKTYEDVLTTYRLVEKCDLVVALKEPKYFYRQNNAGIVSNVSIKNKIACVASRMIRYRNVEYFYPKARSFLIKEIFNYSTELARTVRKASAAEFNEAKAELEPVLEFLSDYRDDFCSLLKLSRISRFELKHMSRGTRRDWLLCNSILSLRDQKYKIKKATKKLTENKKKLKDHLVIDKRRRYYSKCLNMPIKENAVLLESRGAQDFASNILYMAKELKKYPVEIYISVWKNDAKKVAHLLKAAGISDTKFVYKRSLPYYKAFATCKYLFNDMIYEDLIVKREGQVWTNVWHGTPLKCLEYDVHSQRHELGGAAREFLRTDYFAVPSKFMLDKLIDSSRTRNLLRNAKALYSGYPRNQVFFDQNRRNQLRQSLGMEDKEIFVYMPTWRGTFYNHGKTEGDYSMGNILQFFEDTLGENQCIYMKLHNLDNSSVDYSAYTKVLPFPTQYEPYDFLNIADCLITDYSSVFFDFANTRKKIIMFTYDREEYLHDRGLYLSLESLPFPKANTYEELAAELNIHKNYDDRPFRSLYCTYDCNNAAQRIVEKVLLGKESCTEEAIETNGKRNILYYDTRFLVRNDLPDPAQEAIESFTDESVNYYYGLKQRGCKCCPGILLNLPDSIGIFSLAYAPGYTILEKVLLALHFLPRQFLKREMNRELFGMPFDEIHFIDNNRKDPYVRILEGIKKTKYDWRL